jgi:hypothetical protein
VGHPVLDSVLPVVEGSLDVRTDPERLADAGWLAYEELPRPAHLLPFGLRLTRDELADFVLVAGCLNFAYTDFETRRRWDLVLDGGFSNVLAASARACAGRGSSATPTSSTRRSGAAG